MKDTKVSREDSLVLDKFFQDQISVWPLAAANFRAVRAALIKDLTVNGLAVQAQHNPGRITSTSARIDEASLKDRPCFLCAEHRQEGQQALRFEARKGREYDITVNPYPIFPRHFVIASTDHRPQSIWHHYVDMADLAHHFLNCAIYYNGPVSGASAPDHFHFQACPRHSMPLEREADRLLDAVSSVQTDGGVPNGEERPEVPAPVQADIEYVASVQDAQLFHYKHFTKGVFMLRARTSKSLAKLFYRLLDCSPILDGESEPRFNVLTWQAPASQAVGGGERPQGISHGLSPYEYRAVVTLRRSLRSRHWTAEGEGHLTIGPGAVEMAGLFILPVKGDFDRIDSRLLAEVLEDVSIDSATEAEVLWRLTRTQPKIEVGILAAPEITFEMISDGAGPQVVSYQEGKINYNGVLYDELFFEAQTMSTLFAEPTFILHDVVIGIGFHWERKVTQTFAGGLKFIIEGGKVQAVNVIGVEDYLLSVISSEMRSSATLEFLKAHAVISRSWVMSQVAGRKSRRELPEALEGVRGQAEFTTWLDSEVNKGADAHDGEGIPRIVKWFDHSDHKKFDVCADDHCQRYQGLTMAVGETVKKAIDQTWGQILTSGGEICDCRFYKSCGGSTELFSTCWEDKDYGYLPALPDTPGHDPSGHCFCDTHDKGILSQVLNNYDLETEDFFKWTVEYGVEELSDIVRRRSGMDIGTVTALEPLETGPSGRIKTLRITGDKGAFVIGKELMIRQVLSENTLKSSAFTVEWRGGKVILHGYGWGHGVGLCQIGAAVMAYEGYGYREILEHYYPGAQLHDFSKESARD